jgi:type IV pilus assembly protein PilA
MSNLSRRNSRRGFSLIELLIVIAIIIIIITMAVPKYNSAQRYVRETAALNSIQTIHKVQVQYQSQYGRYAASLAELGPPAAAGGVPSPAASDLIGNDLSLGEKQGYRFTLTAEKGGYIVTAVPVTYGVSGNKSFYSDQTMVIRENYGPEPATAQSKEIK